jgi:hypothetical protein
MLPPDEIDAKSTATRAIERGEVGRRGRAGPSVDAGFS